MELAKAFARTKNGKVGRVDPILKGGKEQ